ncbi:MAG: DNA translocase FtsK [Verrucomicrobiota bacterium]
MGKSKKNIDYGLRRLWGLMIVPICVFLFLSLFSYHWQDVPFLKQPPNRPANNLIGPVGAWLSFVLFYLLGIGAYLTPFWLLAFSAMLFTRIERIWNKVGWAALSMLGLLSVFQLHNLWPVKCAEMNIVEPGGIITGLAVRSLVLALSPVGTGILMWSILIGSAVMLPGLHVYSKAAAGIASVYCLAAEKVKAFLASRQDKARLMAKREKMLEKERRRLEKQMKAEETRAAPRQNRKPVPQPKPAAIEPEQTPAQPQLQEEEEIPSPAPSLDAPRAEQAETGLSPSETSYRLPPIDLLENNTQNKSKTVKTDLLTTGRILSETLAEFGIDAEVTNVEKGPVVTRYELRPAAGVRVEKISSLSNNIALSLKATSVRVQAPVPGKGVVGIEIPNSTANLVTIREIIESDEWQQKERHLPLVLGKDVAGNNLVADLADMPHLLIAGATGAGKTVCMNSVLAGLLMSKTPEQLRMMLVDPKIVEFSAYNHLPHLVVPVITDPKKVALALRWAINEMEKRYKLFARVGVRNIAGFNNRPVATQEQLFGDPEAEETKDETPAKLPYIVVIVDELADLMLAAQAEVENCIARLAQLSRAVGIHMILSTQRPSVNVITGTIKANFPARIAFQVAQKVDSRTILDTVGAEKLLGRGDMLFQPPGTSKIVRAQGAMTSDNEIHNIVDFIKKQGQPEYESSIQEKIEKSNAPGAVNNEDDELINQAVQIIRETHRASTSSLQRRLRIGYTRAARIMDILEEKGLIGPPQGSEPREILIDLDGEIPNNP